MGKIEFSNLSEVKFRSNKVSHHSMWTDLALPEDIYPTTSHEPGEVNSILLTGATGFLGSHLLNALLKTTSAKIFCLVRSRNDLSGIQRIRKAFSDYNILEGGLSERILPILGDIRQDRLGLSLTSYNQLCQDVDEVFHAAASVNWIFPYKGLRQINVLGTKKLLRFSCSKKPKNFHFISSIGVCYASTGPDKVTEQDEMVSFLEGMPLGYAQSKCVAEKLVRQAGERGLPISIYRPGLISGSNASGRSNPNDIFSRIIKACIEMECAPDMDWLLDSCPVDYVADVVAQNSLGAASNNGTYHLLNPDPKHWRECVLLMNFYGYPIQLIPFQDWLKLLHEKTKVSTHPLFPLRSFFFSKANGAQSLTLPEFYERKNLNEVSYAMTQQVLSPLGVDCPPLNASLLSSYLDSFCNTDFLPKIIDNNVCKKKPFEFSQKFFESKLKQFYQDESLKVVEALPSGKEPVHSIVSELVSWKFDKIVGLHKYALKVNSLSKNTPGNLEVFIKLKAKDQEVIEVAETVAFTCGEELGHLVSKFRNRLGFSQSHIRELILYRQHDSRFRLHTPTVYGIHQDEKSQAWVLVLENLEKFPLMDSVETVNDWSSEAIKTVLKGLAELHSIWWNRERELLTLPWLEPMLDKKARVEMKNLWRALAKHGEPFFANWGGKSLTRIHQNLVETLEEWCGPLDTLPRTLIHNDFNPRNIALRKTTEGLRLCVYDWELATMGIPQHDLAEFLCFVLTPSSKKKEILIWVEEYRQALEKAVGEKLDSEEWLVGFRASLGDLLINRFSMYLLAHRFHSQSYMQRIILTWKNIYESIFKRQ